MLSPNNEVSSNETEPETWKDVAGQWGIAAAFVSYLIFIVWILYTWFK